MSLSKPKVLIVDDRPENIFAMNKILKKVDAELFTANSGSEALNSILNNNFALILLDVQMPEMNGYEVAEILRSEEETKNIPIIFITAIDRDDEREIKGYDSGAVDYIFKPINARVLLGKVNIFLELYKNRQKLEQYSEDLEVKVEGRTRELKKAKDMAESANRAKSEFLANISHELRTPLHGMLSFAELGIERAGKDPRGELQKFFQKVEISGHILLNLINNLLDLAKLESGKMTFEFQVIDLLDQIGSVVAEFESIIVKKGITILFAKPSFDVKVQADVYKIDQVIRNLLSNAVKFSPNGGEVEIKIEEAKQGFQVLISDQGSGIPENELADIFDKFIQSSLTNTGAGGTGLGLPICREIIASHKGRIWAENRLEGGAQFIFELEKGDGSNF